MNKKKLAVIGYGGMGGFHCRHALESDVVELAGVYDIDPARNEKARTDGIRPYGSLEEVLNDGAVEIVTVATPNDTHMDIVVRALMAGKAVICEKPVALSSRQLDEMIRVSNETGSLFTVHQNRRWDTDKMRVQALYEKGELGRIIDIESRVHGSRGIPGDWRKKPEHGGGMILDWGVHLIDQAFCIVGWQRLASVYCRNDYVTTNEVEDGCHIVMEFENGVFYTVEVGTCNYVSLPRFYMRGENGSAVIVNWNEPMKVVVKRQFSEKDATPVRAESGLTKTMAPRDEDTTYSYEVPMPPSDVHDFYRNFCRAIDGEEEQIVTHGQMRRVMRTMEAAFESARLGQVIKTSI
ncbi:MAG: Gfo/Idh/MocA family oxidoreductase [Clostridia bacterium]|nr:Gfo/Idh/MocA family oxidoreductase [Clostridia bacterium]